MPVWIHNAHADFVVAAYIIVAAGLIALAIMSWWTLRRRQKEWQKLSPPKDAA